MLPSKSSFIDHVRWLRRAAAAHGAQVLVELDSMRAFLRKDGRHWVLHPRFSTEVDGIPRFFTTFADEADHLAGWAPAQPPAWPTAKDKLTFKRSAKRVGLAVPDCAVDDGAEIADIVVKRAFDSFGQHVHGPFRSSAERPIRVEEGEYYERFVEGRALKVWYWNSRPVALERDASPVVVGDGHSTLRTLIQDRVRTRPRITPNRLDRILSRCSTLLHYDGLTLDDIPAKGRTHRVEFRHGCEVMELSDRETVDLRGDPDPQWRELHDAGAKLAQLLPEGMSNGAMYTVDAVQDANGRIWLLQMTAQPVVHPLVYDPLVRSLIALPAPVQASAFEAP